MHDARVLPVHDALDALGYSGRAGATDAAELDPWRGRHVCAGLEAAVWLLGRASGLRVGLSYGGHEHPDSPPAPRPRVNSPLPTLARDPTQERFGAVGGGVALTEPDHLRLYTGGG